MRESVADRVYLRALTLDDLDRVLGWHNDSALYSTLAGHFRYVTRDAEEKWFRCRMDAANEVNLAICIKERSEHIGNAYLRNIDWFNRNAELHTFIGQSQHRSRGYGSAAINLLVDHAFKDLGLARVYLHVLASNSIAIGVYEKCGFSSEGRLRRHVSKAGELQDVIVMGRCRE